MDVVGPAANKVILRRRPPAFACAGGTENLKAGKPHSPQSLPFTFIAVTRWSSSPVLPRRLSLIKRRLLLLSYRRKVVGPAGNAPVADYSSLGWREFYRLVTRTVPVL